MKKRLDALGRIDIAGLTDPYRNRIRQTHAAGQIEEAGRQVSWWEEAFGDGRTELANTLHALRAGPSSPEALRIFGHSAQPLRHPMDRLDAAVVLNSRRQYQRWSFIAKVYRYRLERLVEELSDRAAAQNVRQQTNQASTQASEWPFPVLDAALAARHQRAPASDEDGARSKRDYERRLDLVGEKQRQSQVQKQRVTRRDALYEELRQRAGDRVVSTVRGSLRSLAEEIRYAERAMVILAARVERERGGNAGQSASASLVKSFEPWVDQGRENLLAAMRSTLEALRNR